ERQKIPMSGASNENVILEPIEIEGTSFNVTAVSMGNPHAVVFVDDLKTIDVVKWGPKFENHLAFPEKVNTEFVQVMSPTEAVMIVWERGAGETLACGTGACATLVAGVLCEKLDRKALIHLPGGDLTIEWQAQDNHVIMTGPSETVFSGKVNIELEVTL
ncbi:MAG: diaminopimelate epimerase, partial [Candidatus Margulisbacteria bacterium]|nr:diaminopimelate epimerase [Candidatus Margulisiibacteriota bacterium]